MTTLSKEYLDQQLSKLASKDDIEDVKHLVTAEVGRVERKIEDEIHGLATMVAKGFDDIAKRLDVRDRVEKLEKKMTKVETALNVRL